MAVHKGRIVVETLAGKPTYVDITRQVRDVVRGSGVAEGVVAVISQHTTCAVFTEEFDHDRNPDGDTFLQTDLTNGLQRVFPEQRDWVTYNYPGERHFEEVESWPDVGSLPARRRPPRALERRRPPALHPYRRQRHPRGRGRRPPDERPRERLLRRLRPHAGAHAQGACHRDRRVDCIHQLDARSTVRER